jgi:hypothetical protein
MANFSRWDDSTTKRTGPDTRTRAGVEQDLALGQVIHGLRTEAELSQCEPAERMDATQSVISPEDWIDVERAGGRAVTLAETAARGPDTWRDLVGLHLTHAQGGTCA